MAYRYFYEMIQKIKALQDDGFLPPMIAMFDFAENDDMPLYLQDAQRVAQMRRGFERFSSSHCLHRLEQGDEDTVRASQPVAQSAQGFPATLRPTVANPELNCVSPHVERPRNAHQKTLGTTRPCPVASPWLTSSSHLHVRRKRKGLVSSPRC